jgi:hypothetical protein
LGISPTAGLAHKNKRPATTDELATALLAFFRGQKIDVTTWMKTLVKSAAEGNNADAALLAAMQKAGV